MIVCYYWSARGRQLFQILSIYANIYFQWDHYRILRFGPLVPGCCNGEIQSFYAKSGPFPDHFLNFSGLLVVLSV